MRLSFIAAFAIGFVAIPSAAQARKVGGCLFDTVSLQFVGEAQAQANCLLKRVRPKGVGSDPQPIPPWLRSRLGSPTGPMANKIRAYLAAQGIDPLEVTMPFKDGDAPRLRYFVIHDTSAPELAQPAFPPNIDSPTYSGNRLAGWTSLNGRVNLLIGRDGHSRLITDWGAPRTRPATKTEQNSIAAAARPSFAHVENIQPRIKPNGSWAWIAPMPGFSALQTNRLALAFVIASARAGRWLIPAYHFNIDQGLPDGHDDPQNADLGIWVAQIEQIQAAVADIP